MTAIHNGENGKLDARLRAEVLNLLQYIHRLHSEIAGIALEKDDQTTFDSMSDRLDAIVDSTAQATDTILTAMESVGGYVEQIRANPEAAEIDSLCDAISEKSMAAVEACSFQDLTGQRITKVVGTMKFVEERVNAMAELCGRDEVKALADEWDLPQQLDDGVPLEGPQRAGEGISQDAIDELFA